MSKWFELEAVRPDAYLTPENGVLAVPFTRDFINTVGDELRNRYLVTKAGNVLQWFGAPTAQLSVHFLVNYVIPPGNDPARLRSR
jgi:hypothetical protein